MANAKLCTVNERVWKPEDGDDLADAWAQSLLESDHHAAVLGQLESRPDLTAELLPILIRHGGGQLVLNHLGTVMALSDQQRFKDGQSLFICHGPVILFSLVAASLPECYTIGKAVEVLARTGRLSSDVYARVYRTAQFVLDAMGGDDFTNLSDGLGSMLRVRLLHALVRIRQRKYGGSPVSQEDQVFTLTAFSWVTLRTLERCGFSLSESEREAWVYRWGVIASLLGMRQELIPWTVADSERCFTDYQARYGSRTIAGRKLRRSLVAFLTAMLGENVLGRFAANRVLRELTSSNTLVLLGLPPRGQTDRIVGAAVRLVMADAVARTWITRRFMDGFSHVDRVGFALRLSADLRNSWQNSTVSGGKAQ